MQLRLYWSYATRSLIRGGQRTVLAIFCVAVGVMAIVALQLVSLSINAALLSNIVEANGGDLRLLTVSLAPIKPGDLATFDQLRQSGQITDYATSYEVDANIVLPDGSASDFTLLAVSPNYPLVGQANFIAPSHDLRIQQIVTGDTVAVSSDVFTALHAHIGDTFTAKTNDGRSVDVTIGAEYASGGAFGIGQMVIAQQALDTLPGPNGAPLPVSYSSVYLTVPPAHLEVVTKQLEQDFRTARVISATDLLKQRQKQVDLIKLFLHLVGLLALFIGGVGVINTVQVLLRRRRTEVAVLKTSGYKQFDLIMLFGFETALLGLLGGAFGTAFGLGASALVRNVVERTFFLHLPVIIDRGTLISGLVIGVATALIFGLLPIIQTSSVRPLAVLRESDEGSGAGSRLAGSGLLALLSVLFVVLAAGILGNLLAAILAVYGGALAVGLLGFGFSILVRAIAHLPVYERPDARMLLWLLAALVVAAAGVGVFAGTAWVGYQAAQRNAVEGLGVLIFLGGAGIMIANATLVYLLATLADALVMIAPRSWKTAVMFAFRNIGRQPVRTTTTLTALFVGVFGIGIVVVLGQGIKDTVNTTLASVLRYNVFVIAPTFAAPSVQSSLAGVAGLNQSSVLPSTVGGVRPVQVAGFSAEDLITQLRKADDVEALSTIQGFDLQHGSPELTLRNGRNLGPSDTGTNHAILSGFLEDAPFSLRLGDQVTMSSTDGQVTLPLTIVGFYDDSTPGGNPNFGRILTDETIAQQLTGIERLAIFSLKINPNQLAPLRRAIAQEAPAATVFSLVDLSQLVDQILTNVVIMMTTLASLAMIAGLVIIANAVALAMLERRREIGILKTVGHTSQSILASILIENGLIGLMGALVAMLLVVGAIVTVGPFSFKLTLLINPILVAALVVIATGVTMLVAVLVAWGAARVRPLEVLRYE